VDGASCTGAEAGRLGFGGAGFRAAATAGAAAVDTGRRGGNGALAAGGAGGAARTADGGAGEPGSGIMMLTAGVEAAVGNSALVGLPVGMEGETRAEAGEAGADAFHDGAYRRISWS
jgi:hypothetical protein